MRPVSDDHRSRPPEIPGALIAAGAVNSKTRAGTGRKTTFSIASFCAALLIASVSFYFLESWFKPHKEAALAFVRNDQRAMEALGNPINPGWLMRGKISGDDRSGCARLTIPVSGSIASGSVFYAAIKSEGRWFVLHESLTVGDRRVTVVEYPANANYYSLPRECRE